MKLLNILILLSALLNLYSCKKLIDVKPPETSLTSENVFTSDAVAVSAATALYTNMCNTNLTGPAAQPFFAGTSVFQGLKADELVLFNPNLARYNAYYSNNLQSQYAGSVYPWNTYYTAIYYCNALLEGLDRSTSLTQAVKKQLQGEAKFMRAFVYFYLVNLYGDIPVPKTTDYVVNTSLTRTPITDVYSQIITDLIEAKELLTNAYLGADVITPVMDRVRPNKWVASSFLARVYLYNKDYENAQLEASEVIGEEALFDVANVSLNDVFLTSSKEIIWALPSTLTNPSNNPAEGRLFILPETGPESQTPFYLNSRLLNAFEIGDARRTMWIDSVLSPTLTDTFYYPFKYKVANGVDAPTVEYSVVMRTAELYLIRAEAKVHIGDLAGAAEDLNVIRKRAGLPDIFPDNEALMMDAILHERQVELFTEWGHRWFDLKRLEKLDDVMTDVTEEKGGSWESYKALEPIPADELNSSPGLIGHQNPGYN